MKERRYKVCFEVYGPSMPDGKTITNGNAPLLVEKMQTVLTLDLDELDGKSAKADEKKLGEMVSKFVFDKILDHARKDSK